MVKLYEGGAYLVHGTEIVPENEWRILFWKHTTLPAIWTN